MSQRSYEADLQLIVNGHETALTATVAYEYERESGDGWNEPRTSEFCAIESVEVTDDKGRTVDLYPLLSADCVMGLAEDCLEYERECREPDPDLLRDFRENALI